MRQIRVHMMLLLLLLLLKLSLSHHHGMHLLDVLVERCLRVRRRAGGIQQRGKCLRRKIQIHGSVDRMGRHC